MTLAGRLPVFALLAAAAVLPVACSSVKPVGGVKDATVVSDAALGQVNAFRLANGQAPLAIDRHASNAALAQARNMASHQVMEHNIGFGANFANRMKQDDVPLPAGENLAEGQQSVSAAVTAWENSPPHRRNMLDGSYKAVGVAMARSSETGLPYWSMVLTGG